MTGGEGRFFVSRELRQSRDWRSREERHTAKNGCATRTLLVFAYFGVARELNFLDIGARGEQDFDRDGVSAQTAR